MIRGWGAVFTGNNCVSKMAADDDGSVTKAVGPYLLQRVLGKGQTGF